MSQTTPHTQEPTSYWVGLDWGKSEHSVAVVNDARQLVETFTVGTDLGGLEELKRRLGALGEVRGVAIEATPYPVVSYLHAEGFALYLINPKVSKNWRAGRSAAASKNDALDSHTLAVELSRRHEELEPYAPADPKVEELAGLCQTRRSLVNQRTALIQRLTQDLNAYHPGALAFFSDWSSPAAWKFVQKYPTPKKLARARKDVLKRFLKRNGIGLKPCWLERIDKCSQAARWPAPPNARALEHEALATAAQLIALEEHIRRVADEIAQCFEQLPEAKLMESLPGAGQALAPELTAMAAQAASKPNRLQALRPLTGVAPVEDKSGKRRVTKMRRRCRRYWRNTLHLFAQHSTKYCAWAKAFYELCRQRGDTYATALRKLADKWLKIINRMLAKKQPYDEQRYIQALRKSRSPVYQRLVEKGLVENPVENSPAKT